MKATEQFIAFLKTNGVEVLDRRPGSSNPLPFRGDLEAGEFSGYIEHDFEKDCLGICVHHDAVLQKVGGRADQHALYHMERWISAGGLAYTIEITPEGYVIVAWDLNRRLYSQGWKDITDKPETFGDENVLYKGILVEGSMVGPHNQTGLDEPTPAQMHVLELVRAGFWILFEKSHVTGHFKHGKVACPGQTLESWIRTHNIGKQTELTVHLDSPKEIQEALQLAGFYHKKIDGLFGPASKKALRVFQRTHGLIADGILGPKTIAAFEKAFANGD